MTRLLNLRCLLALLVLLSVLPFQSASVYAADRVTSPLAALTFRMAGDDLRTRIVVMFDREPKLSTLLLDNPHRLVVDLPETRFGFDEKSLEPRGLVSRVRYGLVGKGRSRLILTLRGPFKVEDLRVLRNESASGYRLVADIVATSDREFADQLQGRKEITSSTDRDEKPVQAASQNGTARPFTIMIDPGHGGIDSGAESLSGIKEKDLTLAFGQELKDRLAQDKNIKVLMTREDDTFLRLSERVRIARQHEADLFISIHADTINQHDIRGATVYTISDKASDSVARAMAERENKSDTLAGAAPEEQPEVTDILLDLTRRETHTFSLSFAEKVIHSLQGQVNLINNPHRFAGFQVLRAPDVPSVLIEIGYLSNAEDEKLISNPEWRKKLADRLAIAIKAFEALKHPASLSKG
ncbi:N-acetylmuramoyl-L-alanine amidase [Ochrobactrum sp. 695/2009]|uniref:N-acetylmuramoyl-L-alanine amidase n=1 Tax=Brucella intermedia TaxID=94625 RepID=A0A6N6RBK5_9HYPH|nr:N-acetylmuramoyl-L-alanine amidase [Brucella intermedia]PJR88100.1 N-acetylmuramoyl-L-alanine amidase [Ochrobactrum sp. 721/2009]PJT13795.1 N-acetylmuramoyl-L-alanine amidase [Ochrobactrum sp. 720/2009]PJT25456.1 N-acetylmuramoyl-L-alanine amidase [Ochrobactrum sp. 715/2009]PJT31453.1 N-acetylmuramoyl-L-alanine amidase [Ochrobactrum sp. 695/2009]PJT32245.1 N-acetylmuramoyl-L-alanine amidase [Ochrobactrum sp. 689/2009]